MSAGPAQAADFNCSASAGRITVLGKKVEPVSANLGATACQAVTKTLTGQAVALPAGISAGALVSATQISSTKPGVLATGGIADIRVGALPTLPIKLPTIAVPDAVKTALGNALKGTTVDLKPVKAALNSVLAAVPGGVTTRQLGGVLGGGSGSVGGVVGGATGAVGGATGGATSGVTDAVNGVINQATGIIAGVTSSLVETKALINSIPDSINVGSAVSVDQLLAAVLPALNLPNVDLLRIRGAMAYASGTCVNNTPSVDGSSQVAGISVLGQDLPVGQVVDKVLSLIDSGNVDLSKLSLPVGALGLTAQQSALISALAPAKAALDTAIATATATLDKALAGLPKISIPESLASIKVTPGKQVRSGDSITQQALNVVITIAGQKLVDAVIGEAKASAAGACGAAAPVVTPQDNPTGQQLACSTRRLVLVDVLDKGNRVALTGVADPELAGRTVSIVFGATGQVVAHATVAKDGAFNATAPVPPARLRDSNRARYLAKVGSEKSLDLKLHRRLVVDSMTANGRRVTITGHVVRPLSSPLRSIVIQRRVSCTKNVRVTSVRPHSDGTFRVTVLAPKGLGAAVYRMTTKVPNDQGNGLFETFTLPRAVELSK